MTPCEVIPFPLEKRNGLVREIAAELRRTHGETANILWRGIAKRLLRDLEEDGLDPVTAQAQVRKLFAAVHLELQDAAVALAAAN